MSCRRIGNYLRLLCAVTLLVLASLASASEYRGQVTFGGLPLPGATVTANQDGKEFSTISDWQGLYSFPNLTDGTWAIEVKMTGFATIKQDVIVGPDASAGKWELKMLPVDQIRVESKSVDFIANVEAPQGNGQATPGDSKPSANKAETEDVNQLASDGLLINGTVNNGAASPFAQIAAFGNNRNGAKGLYTGGIGMLLDNSALDARPFSLTGQSTPKPSYNRITGVVTFGGPLKIHRLMPHGPNFFVGYQWTRDHHDTTLSALVPDLAQRKGDFSQAVNANGQPVQIFDPVTGMPFPGSAVPQTRINSQAQALLNFYPSPNVVGNRRYNFQVPIVGNTHQDALQSRFDKTVNRNNELYGDFAFLSTRTDGPNLFGFLDKTDLFGVNTGMHWSHRFSQWLFLNLGYRFSRLSTRGKPYWENRENVSGQAGITGNNQDPMNWGPPTLMFSSGVAGLSDTQSSFDRNQTSALSYSLLWNRNRHNFRFGGDFRHQEFNYLSQQDPRGTFTFTGAATQGIANGRAVGGSDFADFLLGIPDTSSIAFGNADKYFRESVYDAYFTDDWRMSPQFTLNAGIRWEYGAPITELYGRLVNLDVVPDFAAASPVLASNPVGPLTGQRYSNSLINPDKRLVEPRVGVAWRPISGSSLLIRAGYGIYSDTSVYQTIALQMAQQAPLSKSLSVQNSATCPLTLANGLNPCSSVTANTFAIDPNFRVGYAQNWQLSIQRDLPGSLQVTATYLGIKGTRGVQEFLPNTFPVGATIPCPSCPTGFAYVASNGNSARQAGRVQLRRRLHNGLTGILQYTFSRSIDDDSALGGQGGSGATQNMLSNQSSTDTVVVTGTNQNSTANSPTIAQDWLDLRAERGLSAFDQRHLLNMQIQYTTGMGLGGKTLLSGWKSTAFKEWTFITQITVGSGLPETPIYLVPVPGTGVTGSIRPDYTGAPIYMSASGLSLNPAAYAAPLPGEWGDAGRNSIIGPAQFTLNCSIGRIFRLDSRFNLDFRMDSTNLLNHVTFTSWNVTVNSTQFGLPIAVNAMRSIQTTLRLRF
jgi:trimeric autotransporter adhesin